MSKQLYSFSYFIHKSQSRTLRPHELRDGAALAELLVYFAARGYDYQGPILNYPSDSFEGESKVVDTPFLGPSDLLLLTTRPPLDDLLQKDRKYIDPSNTSLESAVFAALRPYFEICTRSHMKLSLSMANKLNPPWTDRADIKFKQHLGPWYKMLKGYKALRWEPAGSSRKLTAAYLVRLNHLWENGPALLAAFGMSGVETLVWTYLLRRRYPDLLERPVFVMAELEAPPLPARPLTLDFAEDWETRLLIEHAL